MRFVASNSVEAGQHTFLKPMRQKRWLDVFLEKMYHLDIVQLLLCREISIIPRTIQVLLSKESPLSNIGADRNTSVLLLYQIRGVSLVIFMLDFKGK